MLEQKVSILMPVYNEERTVGKVLHKILGLEFVHEVIIVDDGSQDKSVEVIQGIKDEKIKFYPQSQNRGKTAAINFAFKKITGDIVIIQDADMEYDPYEIENVINPIIQDQADVVYGSRFLVHKAARVLYFYHYLGNKTLTFLCNLLTNLNMTDIETCYKAFRANIIKDMELKSKGFGMEVEITAYVSSLPIRIYEVPISYYGRTYEEGKKIGTIDGLYALFYIVYFNFFKKSVFSEQRQRYFATKS